VITVVDERLRREASSLELRFTCVHCVHYDPPARACGNGYPTEPHLDVELDAASEITFCKDFELA